MTKIGKIIPEILKKLLDNADTYGIIEAYNQPTPEDQKMKLDIGTQDVNVHGDFETSDFAIGDIAFIVDMFADKVYSHKERAVIRELSCNAHDSHILAGTTDIPFEVHLPTQLEPHFSIRDYGTGLSDDEIRNIFAGIGISTKRDSNDVIGCFGIGSLSPYSLTDSFTVKSYKNGVCSTYTCYRDEERKPVVALLTNLDTDEANGLEVSLTVEDRVWEFQREATQVFRFWEGTLPKINDQSVVQECEEQRKQYVFNGDDFGLTPSWGSMVAIMGNIAYAIPDELDEFDTVGYLKFELGELNFDTARENLSMDEKTKQAIKDKFQTVKNKLATEASQQIEQQPTAFKRAVMASGLRSGNLGQHIKVDMSKHDLPTPSKDIVYFSRSYGRTDKGTINRILIDTHVKYYRYKDRMQSRIRQYLQDHSKLTMVILTDEQIKECKVDDDVLLDLEDLPKVIRQSYAKSGSKVKTFTFKHNNDWWHKSSKHWEETELTIDEKEIVYVEINRWEPVKTGVVYSSLREIGRTLDKLKQCGLSVPTVAGLKTSFTKTKQFRDGNFIDLEEYVKRELEANPPSTYYKFDKAQYRDLRDLNKVINCQQVNDIITLIESCESSSISTWIAHLTEHDFISTKMQENSLPQDKIDEFYSKYELLPIFSSWEIRDNKYKIARYLGGTVRNENSKTEK